MKDLGIYVHIPFCKSKCLYCDFNSYSGADNLVPGYFSALKDEISSFDSNGYLVKTIFVGGGTPTVVDTKYIVDLINLIKEKFSVSAQCELTIEANPATISLEGLKALKVVGFNRLSMGLQSANNNELKALGRIHSYKEFLDSYDSAIKAGFDNINVDLMIGIPYQNMESFMNTVAQVLSLKPNHISVYSLQIEEGTKFFELYDEGKLNLPSEDEEREIYWKCKKMLAERGYKHYEISNWAVPGKESRHNLSYWTGVEYVGFGAGAHSYLDHRRVSNPEGLKDYMKCHERTETNEYINLELQMKEFMMLGFRLIDGVKDEDFKRKFGGNFEHVFKKELSRLMKDNLIEKTLDGYRLSDKGLDLGNLVFGEFV